MAVAEAGMIRADHTHDGRVVRIAAPAVVAVLVFALSLGIRLAGLDLYSTTDEGYWMQRTVRFGAALARGDLASTYRAGHPGVSVMWTGLLGIGPERLAVYLPERFVQHDALERSPGYLEAFSAARRAIAVLTSALVALAVLLAWRLLGTGPALAGGAFLVLDPYVVGMTRLLHVDALLAPLMTVSALAGLIYWTRSPHWGYLLLSAVTGGLALLTKAPSGFLPIFFGLVCITALVRDAPRTGARRSALRHLIPLLVWGPGAAAVYGLLFPALWTDPLGRIVSLARFVVLVGLQPHDGNFFLGQPVVEDPGPFYYLVAVPLRLSPLIALGMGLFALRAAPDENRATVRWLLLYVALFGVLMTLASKKFDRYMLPAQMMLDLAAGVGIWRLVLLLTGRPTPGVRASVLVALLAIVQVVLLARVWPYPIAYYNPLAGGPERARQLIMVGWGEGLEQAAAFLNGLPNAESLYVVTSYNHVVRPRFVGTTIPMAPYVRGDMGQRLPVPDYIVLYVNARQRRQISPEVAQAEALGQPVFVAQVNGLPYAWVYAIPRTEPRPAEPLPAVDEPDLTEN
ncbi:MAG TPA: glycosyltransferase family 39 protein [Chloroflexota bacterium]|nr:glycosyltransferase family 39 protein [Chloroflexota bacterium]